MSGAVGIAFLTLAELEGAQVYGTASAGKHAALRALGATPFDYADNRWIGAMQQLGGVDAGSTGVGSIIIEVNREAQTTGVHNT